MRAPSLDASFVFICYKFQGRRDREGSEAPQTQQEGENLDKNSELRARVTSFLKKTIYCFLNPFLEQRTKCQPEGKSPHPPGASMKLKGRTEEFHLSEGDPSLAN